MNYYPDGCDGSSIEAFITDCFNEGPSDDDTSDKECDHRNEGIIISIKINVNNYIKSFQIHKRQQCTMGA